MSMVVLGITKSDSVEMVALIFTFLESSVSKPVSTIIVSVLVKPFNSIVSTGRKGVQPSSDASIVKCGTSSLISTM